MVNRTKRIIATTLLSLIGTDVLGNDTPSFNERNNIDSAIRLESVSDKAEDLEEQVIKGIEDFFKDEMMAKRQFDSIYIAAKHLAGLCFTADPDISDGNREANYRKFVEFIMNFLVTRSSDNLKIEFPPGMGPDPAIFALLDSIELNSAPLIFSGIPPYISRWHGNGTYAIDIRAPKDSKYVWKFGKASIVYVGRQDDVGLFVDIKDSSGTYHRISHLSKISPALNIKTRYRRHPMEIDSGFEIGTIGTSGHVHKVNGRKREHFHYKLFYYGRTGSGIVEVPVHIEVGIGKLLRETDFGYYRWYHPEFFNQQHN